MQQIISLIVAMNQERVIGANNQLPWHIPEDLAYFKQVTLGKPIIMGRKTFESIGRVLPGRTNIVISRSQFASRGVISYPSLEAALAAHTDAAELCIIGGGEIFKQALALANCLHLTYVDYPQVADACAWFPQLDLTLWQQHDAKDYVSSSGIKCALRVYQRIGDYAAK